MVRWCSMSQTIREFSVELAAQSVSVATAKQSRSKVRSGQPGASVLLGVLICGY